MNKWKSAALCLLLTLTGCSQAHTPSKTPLSKSKVENDPVYEFVFCAPLIENDYWVDYISGIKMADKDFGTKTTIIGSPDEEDWEFHIYESLNEAISYKPDGILTYAGIDTLDPLFDQAALEKIPVVALEGDVSESKRVAHVSTNAFEMGNQAGRKMIEFTGGQGKIGVLIASEHAGKDLEILRGFQNAISDYEIEISFIESAYGSKELAAKITRESVEQMEDLVGIFATTSTHVTGCASVKEELGLEDLFLIGFDETKENMEFLKKGVINSLILQSPKNAGYLAVKTLKDYLDNGSLPKSDYFVSGQIIGPDYFETQNELKK